MPKLLSVLAAVAAIAAPSTLAAGSDRAAVVVAHGQPVQITVAAIDDPALSQFSVSIERAVALAVLLHPTVRGFRVRVKHVVTACAGDNTAAATAVVRNAQNVALVGHICSGGFESALPIYEAAGLVTISGSASGDALPNLGPTVFNRTIVADAQGGTAWYETVKRLPADVIWRRVYELVYGSPPTDFADLYFDATNLLLARIAQVSRVTRDGLVVDRAALASAVRSTKAFAGVTCTITLDPATGNRVPDEAALAGCGASP